jgi:hypothetical protein
MSASVPASHNRFKIIRLAILAVILLGGAGVLAFKLTGHSLGIRSRLASLKDIAFSVINSRYVSGFNKGQYTDIIFLHHSVGHNLIEEGKARELFTQAGYSFFDHDYNNPGLIGPDGEALGYSYSIPNDNTDVDGLARIFQQTVFPLPLNTLSGLLQHEVIIVKSCYPNSAIDSEEHLAQDEAFYLSMRDVMDQHPDKLFIIVTTPPLTPTETIPQDAARARDMANWLKSEEFLKGHPNLFTFDLFDYLAEGDQANLEANMLRADYRNGVDSHPNRVANETIGPKFVEFVIQSINEPR